VLDCLYGETVALLYEELGSSYATLLGRLDERGDYRWPFGVRYVFEQVLVGTLRTPGAPRVTLCEWATGRFARVILRHYLKMYTFS